ncbi:MAG: GntR family transcriptional regulator [Verrucomicrobiales bacterium]|nr:GntR family transcriptional regulator [Verrucomicrobiales bacterium]
MSDAAMSNTQSEGKSFANKTRVVRGLLTELLQGKWQSADRLTEADACQRFKVSRTPVREALFELQGLGLLEIRRNCGAVMLPFGPEELINLYAVRTLLESEAARLAALEADAAEIDKMIDECENVLDSNDENKFWEHDQQIHHYVAKSSGNRSLAAEIKRYESLIQTMREIIDENPRSVRSEALGEHIEILENIKLHKPAEAAEAMRRHLEKAVASAIAAMEAFRVATA